MINNKRFSKWIIVLLITLLIFFVFYYFNWQNQTQSYKPYKTNIFSTEIPSNWSGHVEKDGSNKDIFLFKNEDGKIYITVSQLTAEELQSEGNYLTSETQSDFEQKEIKIAGTKGTQFYGCVGLEGCSYVYNVFVEHAGNYYRINFIDRVDEPNSIFFTFLEHFTFNQS